MNPKSIEQKAHEVAGEAQDVTTQTTASRNDYSLGARIADCEKLLRKYAAAPGSGPVAAWILDNYPLLHTELREIRSAIPKGYYRTLPRLRTGPKSGGTRVEIAAHALVAFSNGEVDGGVLETFFAEYETVRTLALAELWSLGHLVRFALIERVIQEMGKPDASEALIGAAITSLRSLEPVSWKDFVEALSRVDGILRRDPSGDYPKMDFATRDLYRHSVEGIARKSRRKDEDPAAAEERIAEGAVDVATQQSENRHRHVGYWLIDKGLPPFRKASGYRHRTLSSFRAFVLKHPAFHYLTFAGLFTALIVAGLARALGYPPVWSVLFLLLPALHVALAILNPLVTFTLPPRRLARLDFSDGVPAEYKTFVAVPTLLLSRSNVASLLENLEIHYLANRDPNILFALLTDFADSPTAYGPDDGLADICAEGIRNLNQRYGSENHAPFYLFHRPRKWNAAENKWMGHERKRGKLNDFNRFLLGQADAFSLKVGDLEQARGARFVVTLDSDTQLPRDTAHKMIGTLAHPLNRAVFDDKRKVVTDGFGLLQPRVGVSMQSSTKSRLARIYSGTVGYDPYATAVSDVYQDLYGQASFTGKGIYDIAVFEQAAGERFPENTLLSHDLIEGEHVRVGLITDQEVIDDFPARYEAFSKRKHRWVRGDWQIVRWLLPRVPGPDGKTAPNPLSLVARWKIFDNLRRSLMEIAQLLLFIAAWTILPGDRLAWTLVALALFVLPVWFDLIVAAIRIPPPRFMRSYSREVAYRFARGHLDALLTLIFLPHQALLMADAVVRTLIRQFVTHKNLLEWESMAQAESSTGGMSLSGIYLAVAPVLSLAMLLAVPGHQPYSNLAFALLELWLVSPLISIWLDGNPVKAKNITAEDVEFLRDAALKTWRYFADFSNAESNWLIPDNVQEHPPVTAFRTSPTNLGMLLNAQASALDFGHISAPEFAISTQRSLGTLLRLERAQGHFFNWYDTSTLGVMEPRYISAVDSGNLAASLIVTKQASLEAMRRKVASMDELAGITDFCLRLRNELPREARTNAVVRAIDGLLRQLRCGEPNDLFFWEGLYTEALTSARRIAALLQPYDAPDLHYWRDALVSRIEQALEALCHAAPWMCGPLEREFRFSFTDPSMEGILHLLRDVPAYADLPAHYDRIDAALSERLDNRRSMHELTRDALQNLRAALAGAKEYAQSLLNTWNENACAAATLLDQMNFACLFDGKRKLLRIGGNGQGELDDSYYDLLASEARTAVLVGIAKGELPRDAWFHLGRKLTHWRGQHCLVSWSGTLFEYMMPNLFMHSYEGTLLDGSLRSIVKIQRLYAKERRIPWGVSESAYNVRDSLLNYQYHAFGIPAVCARRDVPDRIVVAPYATMLAMMADPRAAIENARELARRGWLGRYGFYEAIDFTRSNGNGRSAHPVVVQAFMAHHQGMTLLAINAALLNGKMRTRFHADPLIQAAEYLLHERIPAAILDQVEELPRLPASVQPPVSAAESAIEEDQLQKA